MTVPRRAARRAPAKGAATIAVLVEDPKWRRLRGLAPRIRRAAACALARAGAPRSSSLTILLAGDARLKELNRLFRGRNAPTNVLSFPADAPYLGDVAIAYGVTAREAKASAKATADHAVHLAVHGVLHLLGHDHVRARQAARMEALEKRILAGLGIADPYLAREAA